MWLRDSTNQVWPYLRFIKRDAKIKTLIIGLIHRQVKCMQIAPYANAFFRTPIVGGWQNAHTEMRPGIHERKYELDSLCAVLRLSHGYYSATRDLSPFDADWQNAVETIIETIRVQQAGTGELDDLPYRFQRDSSNPTETLALNGQGHPARRCGLSKSLFRPSDDAAMLPFLIPANAMAVVNLRHVGEILTVLGNATLAQKAAVLADEIAAAIAQHAVVTHARHGQFYAYEVDGYGSHYLMDDANISQLVELALLGFLRHR